MEQQRLAPHFIGNVSPEVGAEEGALILFTSPTLIGTHIDLIPVGMNDAQVEAAVSERDLPQGVSFAAVYPRLRQGIYSIEGSEQRVTITSGHVTTLDYLEDCCRIYYHPSTTSVLAEGG